MLSILGKKNFSEFKELKELKSYCDEHQKECSKRESEVNKKILELYGYNTSTKVDNKCLVENLSKVLGNMSKTGGREHGVSIYKILFDNPGNRIFLRNYSHNFPEEYRCLTKYLEQSGGKRRPRRSTKKVNKRKI